MAEMTLGPWLSANDVPTRFYFSGGSMTVLSVFTLTLENGKRYRFEWHHYLGPTFVRKDDEPFAKYPSQRHPMWHSFNTWMKQGMRIDMDHNCIYDPEPITKAPRRRRGDPLEIRILESADVERDDVS